jgi:uncharacterized damage-inducible protein DinB
LLGRPSSYAGCGPELAAGCEATLGFFDRCHQETLALLASLTPEQLMQRCTTPGGGSITAWKWLRLLPEHEIHHRGQIYMLLAMLGVSTPPLYGLSSEQVAELRG